MCFIKSGRAAALALLGLLLAGGGAKAQDEARPDTLGVWDVTLTSKLSTTQAAYSNWTEGGINTLAFSAGLSGKAHRRTTRWEQTYDLRLALGFIQQDSFRKADDLIELAAALQYEGDGFFATFNPTVAADARTQFAAGFNYDERPDELQREDAPDPNPPVKVSAFMSSRTCASSPRWAFSVRLRGEAARRPT